jgi:hypothetical protein
MSVVVTGFDGATMKRRRVILFSAPGSIVLAVLPPVVALDARTGNYINHFPIAPPDWHDWDVSNTPAIILTERGKQWLSFAPKNGYLYGFDLATSQLLYGSPVMTSIIWPTEQATAKIVILGLAPSHRRTLGAPHELHETLQAVAR